MSGLKIFHVPLRLKWSKKSFCLSPFDLDISCSPSFAGFKNVWNEIIEKYAQYYAQSTGKKVGSMISHWALQNSRLPGLY